jgi:hypothetical protein
MPKGFREALATAVPAGAAGGRTGLTSPAGSRATTPVTERAAAQSAAEGLADDPRRLPAWSYSESSIK